MLLLQHEALSRKKASFTMHFTVRLLVSRRMFPAAAGPVVL